MHGQPLPWESSSWGHRWRARVGDSTHGQCWPAGRAAQRCTTGGPSSDVAASDVETKRFVTGSRASGIKFQKAGLGFPPGPMHSQMVSEVTQLCSRSCLHSVARDPEWLSPPSVLGGLSDGCNLSLTKHKLILHGASSTYRWLEGDRTALSCLNSLPGGYLALGEDTCPSLPAAPNVPHSG